MNLATATTRQTIDNLRAAIRGSVLEPGDPDFPAATAVFYGEPLEPRLLVRAASTDDVVRTIAFARETGLELAVRSGGHSAAGHGSTDGGVVLDLSPMKGIDLDLDGRTVWAEGGLTAAELSGAVGEHGLAIGFGEPARSESAGSRPAAGSATWSASTA